MLLNEIIDNQILVKAIENFPFSLNITRKDGIMVYANSKFMEGTLEGIPEETIGCYNIFEQEHLAEWGLIDHVKRAFQGEVITTRGLRFPNKEMVGWRYKPEYAFKNIYVDITSYPIFDSVGTLEYVVTYFSPAASFAERDEVMKAKQFIDQNWHSDLTNAMISKHVSLCETRLIGLFKEATGMTPHDYHCEVRFDHLCKLLKDPKYAISDAFRLCGLEYNSHYVSQFKHRKKMTPRAYKAQFK